MEGVTPNRSTADTDVNIGTTYQNAVSPGKCIISSTLTVSATETHGSGDLNVPEDEVTPGNVTQALDEMSLPDIVADGNQHLVMNPTLTMTNKDIVTPANAGEFDFSPLSSDEESVNKNSDKTEANVTETK